MAWEKGEVVGVVVESTEDYVSVQGEGRQYAKKVWKGRQYEGPELPKVGSLVKVAFTTAPAQPGRKYGSSYLDGWEFSTDLPKPAQNGSQTPQTQDHRFVGREPGTADFWVAMRHAYSLAADLLHRKGSEASVEAISKLAGEVFQACYSDALKQKELLEETPAQEENQG